MNVWRNTPTRIDLRLRQQKGAASLGRSYFAPAPVVTDIEILTLSGRDIRGSEWGRFRCCAVAEADSIMFAECYHYRLCRRIGGRRNFAKTYEEVLEVARREKGEHTALAVSDAAPGMRYLSRAEDGVAGTGFDSVVTDLEREAAFQHIEGFLFIVMDMERHPAARLSNDLGDGYSPTRSC
jgi:hypothetical protein